VAVLSREDHLCRSWAKEEELKEGMLKALYAIAIAFLVVAFVGFGISAFYPEPHYPTGYPDDA
jgi:hypothetical protein